MYVAAVTFVGEGRMWKNVGGIFWEFVKDISSGSIFGLYSMKGWRQRWSYFDLRIFEYMYEDF